MLRRILTIAFVYVPAAFVAGSILLVLIFKWAPVPVTPLMIKRGITHAGDEGVRLKYKWTRLEDISRSMRTAVIVAEDARFYKHDGFDFEELAQMRRDVMFDGSPVRGCSTISQQTAKNCFTWCTRSWVRKAVEAYYTVLIERIWGKERILEVYLNVAEMGPGIFGAEAAARRYFHIHARDLTGADASSLACCLPNPCHRNPDWVNRYLPGRRAKVARDVNSLIECAIY